MLQFAHLNMLKSTVFVTHTFTQIIKKKSKFKYEISILHIPFYIPQILPTSHSRSTSSSSSQHYFDENGSIILNRAPSFVIHKVGYAPHSKLDSISYTTAI